jgi:hypothetical protein
LERERARRLSATLSADDPPGALATLKRQIVEQAGSSGMVIPLRGASSHRRWRGLLALSAAAVLLVAVGGWLLFQEPPRPESNPWQLTIEQMRWEVDPTPGDDGRRLKRETRRVRDLLFDENTEPGLILDTERVDTRYIRFTDYR